MTKEEIQQKCKTEFLTPESAHIFTQGATWANEQNTRRIAELETELKDLRFRNEGDELLLQAANQTIEKERAKVAEILTALRDLHDEQNGAPLTRREEHWFQAYRNAGEILKKYNG